MSYYCARPCAWQECRCSTRNTRAKKEQEFLGRELVPGPQKGYQGKCTRRSPLRLVCVALCTYTLYIYIPAFDTPVQEPPPLEWDQTVSSRQSTCWRTKSLDLVNNRLNIILLTTANSEVLRRSCRYGQETFSLKKQKQQDIQSCTGHECVWA